MPMMIVTTIPPGSSPGMTSLASAPAMRPTMIQKIMAVSISVPLLPRRFVYDQTCTHEVSYSKHHHRVHRYLRDPAQPSAGTVKIFCRPSDGSGSMSYLLVAVIIAPRQSGGRKRPF